MLNRIIIMGRLGRDPELRRTPNGIPVASFSLAVDRDYKDKGTGERVTDWIDVVAWRQTAEFVSRYFTKGRMAVVEGRLHMRSWTDKDGNRRVSAEVQADNVYFGDSKRDGDGYGAAPSYGASYGANASYSAGANSYGGGSYTPPAADYGAPDQSASDFSVIDDVDGDLPF